MKKDLLTLMVAAMAAFPLHAQETDIVDNGVRFGIKVAPNMSWLRSDTKGLESDGSKIGFTFGLVTEFPIGAAGNYRFATGLFLNNVGGKITTPFIYTENGNELTKGLVSDLKLRYIELPLTMKLMTKEIGYMRYYGQIGFGAAFNVRAKADFDQPKYDSNNGALLGFESLVDEDVKDFTQPFRASLIIGAGLEYNFSGSTTLQVGVNYNNGLTNISKDRKVGDKNAKVLQDYVELNLAVFF